MAFGGGVLLPAVARNVGVFAISFWFLAGGIRFMALDWLLSRYRYSMAQLVAMLSDFILDALALGAALAFGRRRLFCWQASWRCRTCLKVSITHGKSRTLWRSATPG